MLRFFFGLDQLIFLPSLLLASFGLLILFSVTFETAPDFFYRQAVYLLVALGSFLVISRFDRNFLLSLAFPLYLITLVLLVVTFLIGENVQGSVRWLDLGIVNLQASEFAKPVLILVLASFFSRFPPINLKNIFLSSLIAFIPILLVFKQPDFGNSFVLFFIWGFMLFTAGIKLVYVVLGSIATFIGLPLIWQLLKDYQKSRVLSFLNPESDPLGASYNVVQAIIAFGSGQLLGRGLGRGTQSRLEFLPAEKTDFIFASAGEDLGFLGILIVILLFGFLVFRLLYKARRQKNEVASLVCFGAAAAIFVQFFVNTGVNLGIIPVTGITLPFISYGGSSLISFFLVLGLVEAMSFESKNKKDIELTS